MWPHIKMCVNAVWLQYTGGRGEQCAGNVRSAKKCATFAKVKSICRFIRLSVPDHKNSSFTPVSFTTHSKFLSLVSFYFIWLWVCDLVLVPPLPPSSLSLSLPQLNVIDPNLCVIAKSADRDYSTSVSMERGQGAGGGTQYCHFLKTGFTWQFSCVCDRD